MPLWRNDLLNANEAYVSRMQRPGRGLSAKRDAPAPRPSLFVSEPKLRRHLLATFLAVPKPGAAFQTTCDPPRPHRSGRNGLLHLDIRIHTSPYLFANQAFWVPHTPGPRLPDEGHRDMLTLSMAADRLQPQVHATPGRPSSSLRERAASATTHLVPTISPWYWKAFVADGG